MPLYQYRGKDVEKTFLFIHVPKTGGAAIETYFRSIGLTGYFDPPTYMPVRAYLRSPPTHYDYDMLSRVFALEQLYCFAVVRHPVRRLISEYKWAMEKSTLTGPLSQMTFSDFIRYMFNEYQRNENVAAGHFKPQLRFVGERVRRVFKYEAGLSEVVKQVLSEVGLKFEGATQLPVVNKTSGKAVQPTEGDLALIREFYAEDFAAFSYDGSGV